MTDDQVVNLDSKLNNLSINESKGSDTKYTIKAGLFLTSIVGMASLLGFGMTLASAKKLDPSSFAKGMVRNDKQTEGGAELAMRALKWGTLWAVTGTSLVALAIWKLSGATNIEEFKLKMRTILPGVTKDNPPQGRTEFKDFNDFINYVSTDYRNDTKK